VRALGDVDAAVVVLGDQPRITAEAVAAVAAAAAPDVVAARASYRGRAGHPVLLGRALLARVGELRGDVGFRHLLDGVDVREVEVGGLADPVDIDTREELARL
jgi:CTP:molybdopterin cytidylyltransferase MocA